MAGIADRRATRGQATAEYVATLLVVCILLAGATALVLAVPAVGERVVATVRTGLCIVGGDICRTADAAAAGLSPCLTEERSRRQDTKLDIAVVRLGEHGEWQLALQSDGRALVTRLEGSDAGATVGVGVALSPAGVAATVEGSLVASYRGGRAWRFADAGAAAAFLTRAMREGTVRESRPPDVRWHAVGPDAGADAGVSIGELARAGLAIGAEGAIGLRTEGARRTLTLDLGTTDPHLALDLPGFPGGPGPRRSVVADVSWEGGELRELTLRSVVADRRRQDELSARLDLREPGSRALAERLLRPGSTAGDLRALTLHAAVHGILERTGYAVSERRHGFKAAARLGVALGLEHQQITSERRLVDAVARVRGGRPQRRMDCLGS